MPPSNCDQNHISCTWCYNAIASGQSLHLTGSISKQISHTETIGFDRIIRKIAANDKACLVLLDNGDLYKVCPHTLVKTKLSFIIVEQSAASASQPRRRAGSIFPDDPNTEECQPNAEDTITDITTCDTFSVALTKSNALYTIPSKVHQFAKHECVVRMCGGAEHVLALTSNGDVYAFGSSS